MSVHETAKIKPTIILKLNCMDRLKQNGQNKRPNNSVLGQTTNSNKNQLLYEQLCRRKCEEQRKL